MMLLYKGAVTLGFVLVISSYVSTLDFSDYDFARDAVMRYSSGTQRTVKVAKLNLVDAPRPPPVKRKPISSSSKKRRKPIYKKKASRYGSLGPPLGPEYKAAPDAYELLVDYSGPHHRLSSYGGGFGGGFSGSYGGGYRVFQNRQPKVKLTYVEQTKTYKRRATPSNTFLEALTAIERGVAEAKASEKWRRRKRSNGLQAKSAIDLAVQNRMFPYARNKLGQALYYLKRDSITRRKSNRTTQNQASILMDDLKLSMGAAKFDKFMAVMGDVTLMFAIDTTGSMSDEIDSAKRIAVDVINYPRENPVNYILSPFNDPKTGPVTYNNISEGRLFVEAISRLTATGGGDCPELTMKGILDALYKGSDWGSPLYIFTDASAKDASQTVIEEIKELAKLQGNTINFFTTGRRLCGSKDIYKPFQEIAEATSGQVLYLLNNHELQQLNGFTGSVLGGSNIIGSGSNVFRRKKRAIIGSQNYTIKVDDSIDKMSVCITTERESHGAKISLTGPQGANATSGKISMSRVSIYEITKPKVGTWTLVIPLSVGMHNYFVKSTSETNIDFEHYFMLSIPGSVSDMPVSDPLTGREAKLVLTLAGYNKVQKNTVVLELITRHGQLIQNVSVTPDERGTRFVASFTPPSRPFKLKIKGTTKAGNVFERISRNIVEPKRILVQVLDSDKDLTLRRGQNTSVTLYIFNADAQPELRLIVKDRLGYARQEPSYLTVHPGKGNFTDVVFSTPRDAKVGAGITAMVKVSFNHRSAIVMKPVQLVVVA